VISDEPAIADIGTAVYIIPMDAPEADGTLAWNGTTLAPVTVRAGSEPGIDWTYAAVAVGRSAVDVPDRALDPQGGDAK
jgi:hypothetical protein